MKAKPLPVGDELRMKAAAFDKIMREALKVPPPPAEKKKRTVKKTARKKAP